MVAKVKRVVRKTIVIEKAIEIVVVIAIAIAIVTWILVANLRSTSFKIPTSYTYSKEDKRSY